MSSTTTLISTASRRPYTHPVSPSSPRRVDVAAVVADADECPSPPCAAEIVGAEWSDAYAKAKALVAQMTLEEKVNLTGGVDLGTGCSGTISPIKRLNFTGMCLSDAGNGLRNTDLVNSYPSGIHVGASWNKELAFLRGSSMGGEFKRKGVNVLLGPVVGPAWRVVRGGRNWEGFSVDPYLSGSLVYKSVLGIQEQGVQTSVKHYIANEQETYRTPSSGGAKEAVSSNVDDKTMHEVYLWPFQDAVKAGTGNIMCSYQRINNSYGCANSKTLNGLLKTELGFQGFVVSDWDAQHAGVAAALAGMDMAMPSGSEFWGKHLVEAVKNGSVPESRVTDMATRIVTTWYQFQQDTLFPEPGVGMPKDVTAPHKFVEGRDLSARPVLFQGAVEGHVLVKNTKDTLPLKSPRMLSLFGYSAKSPDLFAPVAGAINSQTWVVGAESIDINEFISNVISFSPNATHSSIGRNGTLIHGCGSGATTPAVFTAPFESLKVRAARDDTPLFHDFVSAEPVVDPLTDTCIVFGNAFACEGFDRPGLYDNYTDTLIRTVAGQCSKTIVVFHNAGIRLVDNFVDHPNVTAIIFAHLPGRDSGDALVSLLYGDLSPSGKLPYTVARNQSGYGHNLNPDWSEGALENFPQSDFTEGVFLDYKHFDKEGIEPRYEFGFGLSYTTFNISNIKVNALQGVNTAEYPTGAIVAGGQSDLWDVLVIVNVDVQNTGKVAGAEVAQLYVAIPNGPTKQLRGFEKRLLQPGEVSTVEFKLTRRDLSVWNTAAQKWQLQRGDYSVLVGSSSKNLPVRGNINF
ncbi:Beta-glucosidase [Purpureocillium takamizusanense]|uniref:Beta-glucosidase cel3A n=1 Tax=Purpureocillium takamizusanense TaxID=2060973 RepID=A0A9Q8Q913_9HYPO|nr:Beta-glucosidase [Purpureocillium takamizusanense]UNI15803.1 Beta-glucosidase [Purpureocillium takamizusanense]